MPLRPLRALMARHRAALAGASGLLLLESATALALPWLAGQAAGRLAQGSSAAPVVALLVAAAGLQALLRWATNWAGARTVPTCWRTCAARCTTISRPSPWASINPAGAAS